MDKLNKPFFSIIIPVYQCEKTLSSCIKSVLAQDESSYEIILTDDGSTDKSGELCDFYLKTYPEKLSVIHKLNEGPLLARIDAIGRARGQYLMFLDSDDRYLPGVLRRVKSTLEAHHADMVIFNHFRAFQDGHIRLCTPLYPDGKVFEASELTRLYTDAVIGSNLNALWQKCVCRELLSNADEFRQNGRMIIGEDKLLSLAMIGNARKVVYLADGLYEYRIMRESISHSLSLEHYRDMSRVYLQTLKYGVRWKLSDYCGILCCKNKVEFGLSCLYSAADKISPHQRDLSEFTALARYIITDQEYWRAFSSCNHILAMHKRIACWLLRRKLIRLTAAYFAAGIILKRLKR